MSRFHTITALFSVTALGAGLSLEGPIRYPLMGILAIAYLLILILGVSVLKLNFFVDATCRGDSSTKRVALTFDDGPDPAATPHLLAVLKRRPIKAAFFPIGTKVRDFPEVVRQINQEGHILGNHSFRHRWWTNFLIGGGLEREIESAQEAIGDAIGKIPAYFRPPMGLTNPHLRRGLRKYGLTVIGWDVRPFDTGTQTDKVIARVLKKVRSGSILLLHDRGRDPADLARLTDRLISEIKARNYTFSGLEELIGIRAYQLAEGKRLEEPSRLIPSRQEAEATRRGGGLWMFVVRKLASTAYVKRAIKEQVTLNAFRVRPTPKFLVGVSLVLLSYALGWPMVGLFAFLAAYFKAPALLVVGPVSYGVSHLVFLLGMYLAGRDCIKYVDIVFSWSLRKTVESAWHRRMH
jgi:peptidoglycan/xylan/chitin deacetylase (PgdA/CDA1 family)